MVQITAQTIEQAKKVKKENPTAKVIVRDPKTKTLKAVSRTGELQPTKTVEGGGVTTSKKVVQAAQPPSTQTKVTAASPPNLPTNQVLKEIERRRKITQQARTREFDKRLQELEEKERKEKEFVEKLGKKIREETKKAVGKTPETKAEAAEVAAFAPELIGGVTTEITSALRKTELTVQQLIKPSPWVKRELIVKEIISTGKKTPEATYESLRASTTDFTSPEAATRSLLNIGILTTGLRSGARTSPLKKSSVEKFSKEATKFEKKLDKISKFEKETTVFDPTARKKGGFQPISEKAIKENVPPELTVTKEIQTQLEYKPYDPLTEIKTKLPFKPVEPVIEKPKTFIPKTQTRLPGTLRNVITESGELIGVIDQPIRRTPVRIPERTTQTTLENLPKISPDKRLMLFTDKKGRRIAKLDLGVGVEVPVLIEDVSFKRPEIQKGANLIKKDPLAATEVRSLPKKIAAETGPIITLEREPRIISKTKKTETPIEKVRTKTETKIEEIISQKPQTKITDKVGSKGILVSEPLADIKTRARSIPITKPLTQQISEATIPKQKQPPRTKTITTPKPKPKVSENLIPKTRIKQKQKFPRIILKDKVISKVREPGFSVLIKEKGKLKEIGTGFERKAALDLLLGRLARGLEATGKIIPTGKPATIKTRTGEFGKYRSAFRTYKLKKGRKIFLEDTFIQKKGKRLITKSERKKLQKARKKKIRFLK